MIATSEKPRPALMIQVRPSAPAMVWLAGLTVFFFLTYGFANWATSLRHHVPSIVFGWEHHIPFVAWMILPYWSTDLLYAFSLFICRTRSELNTHAKRLVAAQIISISGFLLFPLRFTFERPHTAGLFGWLFETLADFDKPFNQAPSLHLSLTTILWAKYSRHLHGWMRWLMRAWMVVMGVSTLTTYQHHFIDIPTGIWVGLLCLAMFPDDVAPARLGSVHDPQRIKFGAVYATCGIFLVGLAFRTGGAAWWLLWPAGALLIVAAVYFTGRPELFRKTKGVISPAMVCLLTPYLTAAWLNSRFWTRKEPHAHQITDGIWLGRLPGKTECDGRAIASIVDLSAELPVDTADVVYRAVPMLDLVPPTVEQLNAAVMAIDELKSERPTLVCCALGYSRSAAALAAWLTANGKAGSVDESIALIRSRRPIVLGPAQLARLEEWNRARATR